MKKNIRIQKQIKKNCKCRCGFPFFISYIVDKIAKKATRNNRGSWRIVEVTKKQRVHAGRVLTGCLFLLLIGYFPLVNAASQSDYKLYDVNVPSLNAAEALNRLAEQTGAIFLFPYDIAETRQANEVVGRYRVMDALDLLLEGSKLSSGLSRKGAIRIFLSDSSQNNNEETSMKKNKLSVGFFAALVSFFGGGADVVAQTETGNVRLEEIVITGVRASLARALDQKRVATDVSDVITAEDIGKFPDLNISESLQRIPGVTIDRDFGEGALINVRGLGPQFSLVQINGVSATSSGFGLHLDDPGGREFNFNMLASELFQQVTIHKTSQAKQTEGGLASVVTLKTPRPFNHVAGENKLSLSLQNARTDLADASDPRGAIFFSRNFDDAWGVAVSLAYSETSTVVNENGTWKFADLGTNITYNATPGDVFTAPNYGHARMADDPRYLRNDVMRETLGGTLTFQFRPNDDLELTFDNIVTNSDSLREYNRHDATLEWDIGGEPINVTTESVGGQDLITSATFPRVRNRVGTQHLDRTETFNSHVLSAAWAATERLTVKPLLGYTKRTGDEETYLYSFYNRIATQLDRVAGGWEFHPVGSSAEYYADRNNASAYLFNVIFSKDRENEDAELVAKLDFELQVADETLTSIDFGLSSASRDKSRVYNRWNAGNASVEVLNPEHYAANQADWDNFWGGDDATQDALLAGAGMTLEQVLGANRSFVTDGITGPSSLLYADHDLIQSIYFDNQHGDAAAINGYHGTDSANGTFDLTEDTLAAYVQGNFEVGAASFNLGLRVVRTDITSNGSQIDSAAGNAITPVSFSSSYTEFLPSANIRYDLNDDVVLRASYSKTMTRPPLVDLAPSVSVDSSRLEGTKGNPGLEPFTADQIDLGVEWYYADEALVSATLFHKRLDSLIEDSTSVEDAMFLDQISQLPRTGAITFRVPSNGKETASVTGLELSLQTPFTFLSEPFDNFGAMLNYTFTDSKASFADAGDVRSTSLPGLSENSYNAVLYYDNQTFDARLAYAWRSEYVDFFPEAKYQEAFGQLDFSTSYEITENFSIQFEALNLTDEQVFKNQSNNVALPVSAEQLERRLILGLRYNL